MIQLKIFYDIESERCQIIMAKEESLLTYEDLLAVIRQHIECFQFIPNEELRIQYLDDEGTYVNLNEQSLEDALRCAVTVSTFRRLKLKISWQPKSTPEMVAAKRRQSAPTDNKMTSSTEHSSQSSRKQLNFADSRSTSKENIPSGSVLSREEINNAIVNSPPRKQQRDCNQASVTCTNTAASSTAPTAENTNYRSPLDLLIQDKMNELAEKKTKVFELHHELELLTAKYGRLDGVDYRKPSCTYCHRREGHNRINCPFKVSGYPCTSAEFCGDITKHKDEKDILSALTGKLQLAEREVKELDTNLAMKLAFKEQQSNSFVKLMRTRLINEIPHRYLNSQGLENWKQVNEDLKKLQAHFKGKIPGEEISLSVALDEYNSKLQTTGGCSARDGNPIRTLWELKGIVWPSSSTNTTSKDNK